MSSSIPAEFQIFCYAIMLGAGCQLLYDGLRIIMTVFVKSAIGTGLLDVGFWGITAICMFVFMYQVNSGIIRGYSIVGMAIGMLLFEFSIGGLLVRYISKWLQSFIKIFRSIVRKILEIIKRLLKIIGKPFTILNKWLENKWNGMVKAHAERKKDKKALHEEEKKQSYQ